MSSYSFAIDWYVRIVEPDPRAPKPQDGEPRPTRTRHLEYAETIYADTFEKAKELRAWHLTHMSDWLPSNAVRDDPHYAPVISEITTDHRHPQS